VPDGEEGELVFTSLTKEAMPIVRYRTRDLSRLLPGSARTMRRMSRITGRSDDMMIIRGVNVFPSQIEEHLLTVASLAPHYQIELGKDGHMDVMTINVEHAKNQTAIVNALQNWRKKLRPMSVFPPRSTSLLRGPSRDLRVKPRASSTTVSQTCASVLY
jgi:phenylacetate-coenzyme A ligase PaaK-like adenylate-forming protein